MAPQYLWIDLETTGLDPSTCFVLEVAALATDEHLNNVIRGPHTVVHTHRQHLVGMDEWCTKTHKKTGLWDEVLDSGCGIQLADTTLSEWIENTFDGKPILCGSTVHFDRAFITRHMPKTRAAIHYRNLDVSTVRRLARDWPPDIPKFEKQDAHRAGPDILESLNELRHYRKHVWGLE